MFLQNVGYRNRKPKTYLFWTFAYGKHRARTGDTKTNKKRSTPSFSPKGIIANGGDKWAHRGMLWQGPLGAQGAPSTGFQKVTSQLRPEGGVLQKKRGNYSEGGVQEKNGPAPNRSLRVPLPISLIPAGTLIPTTLYRSHQRKVTPRFFLDCVFKSFQT